MIKYLPLLLMLLHSYYLNGQEVPVQLVEGRVSFITRQNIYVKFDRPGLVKAGDTILIRRNQALVTLLVAESVSSLSCVGKPVYTSVINLSEAAFLKLKQLPPPVAVKTEPDSAAVTSLPAAPAPARTIASPDGMQESVRGRLSVSSYSGFSGSSDYSQRMRYTFSLTADHLSDGRFSFENYILFTHKIHQWAEVKENIFNALKIYSLAVGYDAGKNTHITLGRKINPRIASLGAIDGIQAESAFRKFHAGVIAGASPDYTNYGFNPQLFEYGAYASHEVAGLHGSMANSFAFVQQTNSGKTDRRFAYFQHDNSLLKNVSLFLSCEVDLYALQSGVPANVTSLTSLYFSLRYRVSRQLNLMASYDARRNVIYYETFKTYLDQMLEEATRQGAQFRVNYNPGRLISTGLSGGYRFRAGDLNPTMNANLYLSFNRVPWQGGSVSLTSNYLSNSYVDGMIWGVKIFQDKILKNLNGGISYRYTGYNYLHANTTSAGHTADLELSLQISRKLAFSAYYSGTLDNSRLYNSIYLNLVRRI